MSARTTPLGAVVRGLGAGVIGTGFMTVAQELAAKLPPSGDGGGQEGGGDPWEQAPMPAQVARRISEGVFHHHVGPERIPLLTHAMHWAYGSGWGAVYGLVAGTFRGPALRSGLAFGAGVWAMSYLQMVPMGLYQPPWKYPPRELALDLGYHLAYGTGVGTGYRVLGGSRR